jgi:hypothetical protein
MTIVDLIAEHGVLTTVGGWISYNNNDRYTIRLRCADVEAEIMKRGRELLSVRLAPMASRARAALLPETQAFLIEAAAFTLWLALNPPEPQSTGNDE